MGRIRFVWQLAFGSGGDELDAGESVNLGQPGGRSGPVGNRFEVWFEDPDGSGNFVGLDEGRFPDCGAPTTTESTAPSAPALVPVSGEGFVASGAEIGPGQATFGATGFAAGEQVTVMLHSTPRDLGTVTASADGLASITFEVLASDGAGEHSVMFTGPSGTVSVPFTLVLPGAAAPPTTAAGQLPVTR
jgi:hypothetical protein